MNPEELETRYKEVVRKIEQRRSDAQQVITLGLFKVPPPPRIMTSAEIRQKAEEVQKTKVFPPVMSSEEIEGKMSAEEMERRLDVVRKKIEQRRKDLAKMNKLENFQLPYSTHIMTRTEITEKAEQIQKTKVYGPV